MSDSGETGRLALRTATEQVLFGADTTEGIVAVEIVGNSARLYRRTGGWVVTEDRPFKRWLLTTTQHRLADAEWTELEGEDYKWLAEFAGQEPYERARQHLRDSHASIICYANWPKQYLTRSGQTLFKGMAFDDVVRMQLDIETLGLNPEFPENEVFLVAISDNRGFETLISGDNEADILRRTVECVRERDPDVIEGHNIHDFDFRYLATRAKMCNVRLSLGRDGSPLTFVTPHSGAVGYFSRPFTPAYIHGRQVIDTLLAVQRWDVSKASLTSYGLKSVAMALGIAESEREYIAHDRIAEEWRSDPERVRTYALQDVRETRSLSRIVCPPDFYLTQMAPDTYSRVATTGTGEKINALMVREYLRQGRAIPEKSRPTPLPGGYTEVRTTGVIHRVVKCDVESLYPSIMITSKIKPANDKLDVFLPSLEELTRRRFAAKKLARDTTGQEHAYWDGMQSALKILINSFYGYLGGPFSFNDYAAAAQITTTGQSLVKRIVEELERTGSQVVEIDTDGVYFRPPDTVHTEEKEHAYVEEIGAALPEGIRLAHDGRYKAMISLKIKNYILANYDGTKSFTGSSLRSRSDERFGLEFISQAADCLFDGRAKDAMELYKSLASKIRSGELGIEQFARRERITEKTFTSSARKRIAAAAGTARVGEYVSVYEKCDGSLALAQDYNHNEDKDYLLDKLYKFACRLREGFGPDFDLMFPRPSARTISEAAGQQTLDLFG